MATLHRQFFGDAERDFALAPDLILELERKTNAGVGALCQRVFHRQFYFTDLSETIRLALIGGGEAPKRAQELVSTYAGERMDESYPLALAILSGLWFGPVVKPATDDNEITVSINGHVMSLEDAVKTTEPTS